LSSKNAICSDPTPRISSNELDFKMFLAALVPTKKEKTDLYPAIRNLSGARCGANGGRCANDRRTVKTCTDFSQRQKNSRLSRSIGEKIWNLNSDFLKRPRASPNSFHPFKSVYLP
jgi:hypothetical protein